MEEANGSGHDGGRQAEEAAAAAAHEGVAGGSERAELLEETVGEDYEPTEQEVQEYAEWLGIDIDEDADLLWIAHQGMKRPLPKPWQPCQSRDGETFYFNPETGVNTWDHPCDESLRELYAAERAKKQSMFAPGYGGAGGGCGPAKVVSAQSCGRGSAAAAVLLGPCGSAPQRKVSLPLPPPVPLGGPLGPLPPLVGSLLDAGSSQPGCASSSSSLVSPRRGVDDRDKDEPAAAAAATAPPVVAAAAQAQTSLDDLLEMSLEFAEDHGTKAEPATEEGKRSGSFDTLSPLLGEQPSGRSINECERGGDYQEKELQEEDEAAAAEGARGAPLPLSPSLAASVAAAEEDEARRLRSRVAELEAAAVDSLAKKTAILDELAEESRECQRWRAAGREKDVQLDCLRAAKKAAANATLQQHFTAMTAAAAQPLEPLPVDAQSPPTPELASILAAELTPQKKQRGGGRGGVAGSSPSPSTVAAVAAAGQEQPSLWSLLLVATPPEDRGAAGVLGGGISSGAGDGSSIGSLEISSLSAMLDRLHAVGSDGAHGGSDGGEGGSEAVAKVATNSVAMAEGAEDTAGGGRAVAAKPGGHRRCPESTSPAKTQKRGFKSSEGGGGGSPHVAADQGFLEATLRSVTSPSWVQLGGARASALCRREERAATAQVLQARLQAAEVSKLVECHACAHHAAESDQLRRQIDRLEELLCCRGEELAAAQDRAEQRGVLAERSLCELHARFAAEERRAQEQLEESHAEVGRLTQEVGQLSEDARTGERLLADAHAALEREQAAHTAARASTREAQREGRALRGQVHGQEVEDERTKAQLERCRSEVVEQEAENNQLQLELHARDAELGQLRAQQRALSYQNDAAARRCRLGQAEREQALDARECFLDERERLAREVEAAIREKRRELCAELQHAELANLRAVLEVAPPQPSQHCPSSESAVGTEGCAGTRPLCGGKHKVDGPMRLRRSTSVPVAMTPPDGNAQVSWSSIEESYCDGERGAIMPPCRLSATADCSPSSASSNSSVQEPKGHCGSISDDVAGMPSRVPTSCGSHPAALGPRCLGAESPKELTEVRRAWRCELRDNHAALETDRRRWRSDARRAQKAGSRQELEILAEVRAALDERAASLNRSIGEYRAFERVLAAKRRPQARVVSSSKLGDAGADAATAIAASAKAPVQPSPSLVTQVQPLTPSRQDRVLLQQRWQHVLAGAAGGSGGGAGAASGGTARYPRRGDTCRTAATTTVSSCASAAATPRRRPMGAVLGAELVGRPAAHTCLVHTHADRPHGSGGGGSPRGDHHRCATASAPRSAHVGGA